MANPSYLGLWKKNVRGTFFGVYQKVFETDYVSIGHALVLTLHTFFLPITLTVGAGIKTLIDIFSRNPLSQDNINKQHKKIDRLTTQQVENISSELVLLSREVSSLSSNQLVHRLEDLKEEEDKQEKLYIDSQIKKTMDKKLEEVKNNLGETKETEDNASLAQTIFKKSLTLDPLAEGDRKKMAEEIKNENNKEIQVIHNTYTEIKKDLIGKYFSSPENNGKQTHGTLFEKLKNLNSMEDEKQVQEDQKNKEITVDFDDSFENAINQRIKSLRANGAVRKAAQIEGALTEYKQKHNADSYNRLLDVLDKRRVGGDLTGFSYIKGKHTTSFNQVFFREEEDETTYNIPIFTRERIVYPMRIH